MNNHQLFNDDPDDPDLWPADLWMGSNGSIKIEGTGVILNYGLITVDPPYWPPDDLYDPCDPDIWQEELQTLRVINNDQWIN